MTESRNIPRKINDNCPSCNPIKTMASTASYTGEQEGDEYLYSCNNCGAGVWLTLEQAKEVRAND